MAGDHRERTRRGWVGHKCEPLARESSPRWVRENRDGLDHGLQIPRRIGAGAFDYDFGAIDEAENPLTKSYEDLAYEPPYPALSDTLGNELCLQTPRNQWNRKQGAPFHC